VTDPGSASPDDPYSDSSDTSVSPDDGDSAGSSHDPNDLGALDPQQFVGDAPAGDAHPGEFLSDDQSGGTGADDDGETDGETDSESDEAPATQEEEL